MTGTNIQFWSYLTEFFLRRESFQKNFVEKIEIHIMHNFYNRGVYKLRWKNIVEPKRPQVTISRMRITCWIHKATNTHSDNVILVTFTLHRWFLERACLLLSSVHYMSCWIFIKSSCSLHFEPSSFYLNGWTVKIGLQNKHCVARYKIVCHRQCGFLLL